MISVLMALRNGVEFFQDAWQSLCKQTHTDWELIVGINGLGPKSVTYDIVVGVDDPRIVVLDLPHCPNKTCATNQMVQVAKSDIIGILDVDDMWHPEKLARQLPYLGDYDVVGTPGNYFGDVSAPINTLSGPITFDALLERNHMINSSILMHRVDAHYQETDLLDDYQHWLAMAFAGKRFVNVPGEALTYIRCHKDQWFAGQRDNSGEIREHYKKLAGRS